MAEVTVQSTETPDEGRILGKFNSQDELVNAYRELEKKLSQSGKTIEAGTDEPTSEPPSVPSETPSEPTETSSNEAEQQTSPYGEAIVQGLTAAGLDAGAVGEEFYSESGLTEETRAKLDATFGKDVVEMYLKGLEVANGAQQQQATEGSERILETVGGQEAWDVISSWAAGPNADTALVDTFNQAIDRGDVGAMQATAIALKAVYEQRNGTIKAGSVKSGAPTASGDASGFRSNAELTKAISDPRYAQDPAYREDVAKRLSNTKGFSVS